MANKKWLYNKNVIITGASSGIGFFLAKILALKFGCNIIGTGRSEQKLIKAKEQIDELLNDQKESRKHQKGSYNYYPFDVSNFESWQKFKTNLEEKGFNVDVLINNAGVFLPFENFETQDLDKALKLVQINFYSHLYAYKTFGQTLKNKKGAFISIASSSALCPVVGASVYSASKAATKNFIESLRVEHRKDMFVSLVCPGFADTDLFREQELSRLVKSICMPAEKMAKKIVRKIARKRRRIVVGFDAHLMNGFYKIFPRSAGKTIATVLKLAHDPMFDNVFEGNDKKRKKRAVESEKE